MSAAIEKNIMKPKGFGPRRQREEKEFDERVIEVSRVTRVVKGGRRLRFRALVVIGDKKNRVGMGLGKATEVAEAVKKATTKAKKNIITVPIIKGTIPHEVVGKHGAATVLLKPASEGTSIVAGGSVRTVVELAGISDILGKIQGSKNKINNVLATLNALTSFNQGVIDKLQLIESKSERKEIKPIENNDQPIAEKATEPVEEKESPKKPKDPIKIVDNKTQKNKKL